MRGLLRNFFFGYLIISISGCYFFRKKKTGESFSENDDAVIGNPLGPKAGGPNYARLEEIYAITTDQAPAAIRPDPDVYVRQLLLQYRDEGSNVARAIGNIEQYRELLGGASIDFAKDPQLQYDATSLLASIKVAEEICEALVAPSQEEYPGWNSILPADPSDRNQNLKFLAQRFVGIHSNDIDSNILDGLNSILDQVGGSNSNSSYIPVCVALAIDAQSLLL